MTVNTLESTLRSLMRRRPFIPFVFEMDDGRRIFVDDPEAVSFGGGSVGYIGPAEEIYFLRCENVLAIKPAIQETAP